MKEKLFETAAMLNPQTLVARSIPFTIGLIVNIPVFVKITDEALSGFSIEDRLHHGSAHGSPA